MRSLKQQKFDRRVFSVLLVTAILLWIVTAVQYSREGIWLPFCWAAVLVTTFFAMDAYGYFWGNGSGKEDFRLILNTWAPTYFRHPQ